MIETAEAIETVKEVLQSSQADIFKISDSTEPPWESKEVSDNKTPDSIYSISDSKEPSWENKEGYGLPSEVSELWKRMGLTEAEISQLITKFEGRGDSIFRIPQDDEIGKKHCQQSIDYLKNGYKNDLSHEDNNFTALAELVDNMPDSIKENLIKDWENLRDGKIGIEYVNAKYITNMDRFSYYVTDVKETLGVDAFPSNRHGFDEHGRYGCFKLADLSTEIEQGKLSPDDIQRAKELAPKIYNYQPGYTKDELIEFNKIVDKTPNYACNEMTWDEHVNGHTLGLTPSGYLHSGSGGASGLDHTGGNALIRAAEEIRENRGSIT